MCISLFVNQPCSPAIMYVLRIQRTILVVVVVVVFLMSNIFVKFIISSVLTFLCDVKQ